MKVSGNHTGLQGTGNVINLGMQSYGLWMQSIIDDISNDDQIGMAAGGRPPSRKFGECRSQIHMPDQPGSTAVIPQMPGLRWLCQLSL